MLCIYVSTMEVIIRYNRGEGFLLKEGGGKEGNK